MTNNTTSNKFLSDKKWIPANYMNVARIGHIATRLHDGTVLVTGGLNSRVVKSTEFFDPKRKQWTLTKGDMNFARINHTATLLEDGSVLVTGGNGDNNDNSFDSTELYDPKTQKWTLISPMNVARQSHTATLLQDGVLVAGGWKQGTGPENTAEFYNYKTKTWTLVDHMTVARYDHTATLLQNGTVLVAAGSGNSGRFPATFSSTELYDPKTQKWGLGGYLNNGREKHTATALPNGSVLVVGGKKGMLGAGGQKSAELYKFSSNTWKPAGSTGIERVGHTATLVGSTTVLVTGGENQFTSELFNIQNNKWTPAWPMREERAFHTATFLNDDALLVAGGLNYDNGKILSSAELYVTST